MVVLQLQEPPSVDVSMDNHDEQQQTPATPLKKDPVAKAEAPAKKQAALASKPATQKKQRKSAKAAAEASETQIPAQVPPTAVKQAQIVVVFPIGIPGMGKTHFA